MWKNKAEKSINNEFSIKKLQFSISLSQKCLVILHTKNNNKTQKLASARIFCMLCALNRKLFSTPKMKEIRARNENYIFGFCVRSASMVNPLQHNHNNSLIPLLLCFCFSFLLYHQHLFPAMFLRIC